jgi:hypothetical protein
MGTSKTRRARRAAWLTLLVAVGALALTMSAAQVPPFNAWDATQKLDSPSAPFTPRGPYQTYYWYTPTWDR